jgi:hypothetical protein
LPVHGKHLDGIFHIVYSNGTNSERR